MTESPLLCIENVHSYYGTSHVLQGVSIVLQSGVIALVGRNGMGKTTLVKTIMGIVPAREGKILFHDRNITNFQSHQIGALGICY
jgi:ABC-type branched-subunit amino acid transport system ATPase component